MDWQLLIVGVLVVLALSYLGQQTLRTWIGKGKGCGGCKCERATKSPDSVATQGTLIPVEQIKLRRR